MREFFVLAYDDRDDLQSVSGREMGSFDFTVFWIGTPLREAIPENVKLFVDKGGPRDYLSNPISWVIVSDRLLNILHSLVPNDIEVFPAPLYEEGTQKPIPGYHVVNVIRCVDALATPLVTVDKIVFKESAIPSDAHLFRISGHTTLLVVSDDLVRALSGKGLQGLSFIRTKCV